jgi:outer membrane protein OmpU
MKKILLGTTTLIGAAALFAGHAFADTPKVTVGGYTNFEAGYMNDDDTGTSSAGHTTAGGAPNAIHERGQAFREDTQVDFKIDGKNDSGLGYGGEIDLLADTSADVQDRGINASKTYIYMDGSWGRFEMGSEVGADGTMKVDAGTIARATGGINGDANYFANSNSTFLAMAALPLAYGSTGGQNGVVKNNLGDHAEENINKVTYYTPRWWGFQAGVSYLPDETNRGQGAPLATFAAPLGPDRSNNNAGLSQNIWTGGINYDNKFGDWGVTAAVTGERGTAQTVTSERLAAWNAGAKVSYMGWSLAGSYGDWGKSNTLTAANSKSTWYADAGIAYEYGPFGASFTYLYSKFDCGTVAAAAGNTANCGAHAANLGENKYQSYSGGVDYKLAPGLTPYAEFTYYNQRAFTVANENKGYVGILGTQLNF